MRRVVVGGGFDERSLDAVRVPLDSILADTGVARIRGDVTHVDSSERRVTVASRSGTRPLPYDRLVLAAGSELNRPTIPGMELAFCIDTFAQAEALQGHLRKLRSVSDVDGSDTTWLNLQF